MKNELTKRIAGGIDNGIAAKVHKFDRRVSLEAGIKNGCPARFLPTREK